MKKILCVLAALCLMITGCSHEANVVYTQGMFTDVRDFDFYVDAVKLCVENDYMDYEGDTFGVYDTMSLFECADTVLRISGTRTDNVIETAIKMRCVPKNYDDWDRAATRAEAAYMLSHAITTAEINEVADGAISDVADCPEIDEIYHLYRSGIFSGDKKSNTFRPNENIVRAEMAIAVERMTDETKRVHFSMEETEASVVAFGDVIGHTPVLDSAKTESGYDFTPLFANVKKYIDEADIACINQETIFTDGNYTGYPAFSSPQEIGEAEAEAGFDVVTQATNHAYDKGESAILYTAKFWSQYTDIKMLGIHETEADSSKIEIIEKNGIKIALLNYTYSLNGFTLPEGKDYLVDLLSDKEAIRSDMQQAKKDSDAIIVFLHFGEEYQTKENDEQAEWAQFFADEGATVIVGAHPHVVEPLRVVTASDGRQVPVYYSLGNFVSSQNDLKCTLGAMAKFTLLKTSDGVSVTGAEILPLVTHQERGNYTAYLLDDYTEELASKHRFSTEYPRRFSIENLQEMFDNIVK